MYIGESERVSHTNPPPHSVSQTPPVHQTIIHHKAHLNHTGNCNYKPIKHTTMKAIKLFVDADTAIFSQLRANTPEDEFYMFVSGVDMNDKGVLSTVSCSETGLTILDFLTNIIKNCTPREDIRKSILKAKQLLICSDDEWIENESAHRTMKDVNPKVFEGLIYDKDSGLYVGTLIIL